MGYINAYFFIPFFKENEASDFLEAHGYEFVSCEDTISDGRHNLEENLITRLYSYKSYYQITAKSILDGSEKTFKLILTKTYLPFHQKRELHYFEDS
ncbi:hypothetical protein ITJ86_13940 [Winogradskyella sp. F6397]|uniref:Uncharacterized protein n=1 Tax=Winogradskyella marina TaxID=2785530 RepID=A0ABS0EL68_9FLAO|nr:hypothetical protein [Winogradskyella marina]MBF8151008.1 hypothetical protein [Winogradskyella marina]